MGGRTDQQCMGRWRRHLDPNVTRGAWSAEEDVALRDLYNRLGPKWSLICRSVPGRTAQQCRARWFQIDGSTTSERTGEESRSERANGRFSDHEGLAVTPPMASLSPTPGAPAFRQILAEVSARTSAPSVGRVDAHHQHAQTRTPVRASLRLRIDHLCVALSPTHALTCEARCAERGCAAWAGYVENRRVRYEQRKFKAARPRAAPLGWPLRYASRLVS